jgi:hypothetical protein
MEVNLYPVMPDFPNPFFASFLAVALLSFREEIV